MSQSVGKIYWGTAFFLASVGAWADSGPLTMFQAGIMQPLCDIVSTERAFHGSTTFLMYGDFRGPAKYVPGKFADAASAQPKIALQISLEPNHLSLDQIISAIQNGLSGKSNPTYEGLLQWVSLLRDQGPVLLRPMSEMNDSGSAWELGYPGVDNSPEKFAKAWILLHQMFDQEGVKNVAFLFVPMSGSWGNAQPTFKGELITRTLSLIPKGMIDAFGLTVYTRARDGAPVPFSEIVQPWMALYKTTHHSQVPFVIGEMGVPNNNLTQTHPNRNQMGILKPGTAAFQAWDLQRAQWITSAFEFSRTHEIKALTYFNDPSVVWGINAETDREANQALKRGIAGSVESDF